MIVHMLTNPSAAGGRAVRVARKTADILRAAGVDLVSAESRSAEHLTELARGAASQGASDRIIIVGGDGSWHFALNGLVGSQRPAALIPCGRGNDYGRNINLPRKIKDAVEVALNGPVRELDLIWTGKRHYIGVGGVGFDSEVTECANTKIPLVAGTLAYSLAVFYKLFAFKPKTIRIEHDSGVYEGRIMFAVFANSKSYGGGMKIAPKAEMDDGLIDMIIVEEIGIPTLLATMPKVFSGAHLPHPRIRTVRTRRLALTTPDKLDLYGDGEYIQPAPLSLEIRPKALRVVVP